MPGPKILVPDWDARQMVELETPDGHSGYVSVEAVRSMLVWVDRVEKGLERRIGSSDPCSELQEPGGDQ